MKTEREKLEVRKKKATSRCSCKKNPLGEKVNAVISVFLIFCRNEKSMKTKREKLEVREKKGH